MTARRIALVAWHAFLEHARDRWLVGLAACVLVLVVTALVAGPLSAGEQVKVVKDVGLALVEFAGALMSVAIGVGLVAREIDRRSILGLLAKPLPRWELVAGKYAGLVLTITVATMMVSAALFGALSVIGGVDARLLVAIAMIVAELSLLTAVALFFSAFSSSALVSMALTAGVFVAGQLSADLRGFREMADAPPVVASLMAAVGWLLPDFSSFDVKSQVVHGEPVAGRVVWLTLGYGAAYSVALVSAAIALFSRRELR